MKNAPFAETLVSADTKNADALAARQHLQTVLDQINPAAGKMDPGGPTKKQKKALKNQPAMDTENANAPSE